MPTMDGPEIIAHTLSQRTTPDKNGNSWQYRSRSDHHSRVTCWAVLFDVLQHSALLRHHVETDRIVFAVGHQMYDQEADRTKKVDLVLGLPAQHDSPPARQPASFHSLAVDWSIRLGDPQYQVLADLPRISSGPVGEVLMAIEAKACMTEHSKAFPRLLDELSASHTTIHGDTDTAIAVGLGIINASRTFISPDRNKHDLSMLPAVVTIHRQPEQAARAIARLEKVPVRSGPGQNGYDAFGIVVLDLSNDGTPVTVVRHEPAPEPEDQFFYDQMIRRLSKRYEKSFSDLP